MSRANWKGPISFKRSTTITPSLLASSPILLVHNGRAFYPIKLTPDRVGFKLGAFLSPKSPAIFPASR